MQIEASRCDADEKWKCQKQTAKGSSRMIMRTPQWVCH